MRKLVILIVGFGVAVLIGYLILNSPPTQAVVDEIISQADDPIKAQYREFLAMKARWHANPVDHYRLRVSIDSMMRTDCERDAEVQHERVVRIFEDTCTTQGDAMSVTDLFAALDRQIPREIDWINGFGCDLWVSHSEYDPNWNFPRRIEVTQDWMTTSNIGEYKYKLIQSVIGEMHMCHLLGMYKAPVEVISFTVLP
jgi:hypothetical protein